MSNKKVILKTSARLHFNSLKMNQLGGRGCGGVGLAIDDPVLELEFSYNKKIIVLGSDEYLKNKAIIFARSIIKYLKISSGIKIKIRKSFPSHIGLGSGTQLGLIVGKGISLLYKKKISLREIAFVNKRAGVSGIGYYSLMHGGLIIDGGYRMGPNENKKTFDEHALYPPSLIGRYGFPKKWKILLITPIVSSASSEVDESSLFAKNTPIPLTEVEAICTNTLMGLVPSLLDKNYFEFMDNLFDIIRLGTKKIELELNKKHLKEVMSSLNDLVAFKWRRLGNCKFILISDEQKLLHRKISDYLNLAKRYEVKNNLISSSNNFFKNKIPFLGISSLGPTMYSILSEEHHNIEYLLRKTKDKLGKDWDVKVVNAKNNPCICKLVK